MLSLKPAPLTPLVPHAPVLLVLVQLGAFAFALPALRRDPRLPWSLLAAWGALGAWASLTALMSEAPLLSLSRTAAVFLPGTLLVLLVAADPAPRRTLENLALALSVLVALLAAAGALISRFGATDVEGHRQTLSIGALSVAQLVVVGETPFPRIASFTENPNLLASWIAVAMTLTCYLQLSGRIPAWMAYALLLIDATALVLTLSRTGIATAFLALGVLNALALVVAPERRAKVWAAGNLFALAVAATLTTVALAEMPHSPRFTLDVAERGLLWSLTLDAALAHPVFGVGFGVAKELVLVPHGLDYSPHQAYLTVLAETGVPGLALLLAIWLSGLAKAFSGMLSRDAAPGRPGRLEAAVAFALLSGLAAHQLFETSVTRVGLLTCVWLYLVALSATSSPGAHDLAWRDARSRLLRRLPRGRSIFHPDAAPRDVMSRRGGIRAPTWPEEPRDGVTLGAVLEVLRRHRAAAAGAAALLFLGGIAATALIEPTYEAEASLMALHEPEELLALLRGDRYALTLAQDPALVARIDADGPVEATRLLREHVVMVPSWSSVPDGTQGVIIIRATWSDAETAALIASAYARHVDSLRPALEEATRSRLWGEYLENAGGDAARADADLDALVAGLTYHQVLSEGTRPDAPTHPRWGVNLALSALVGSLSALATPLVIGAVEQARAGRGAPREQARPIVTFEQIEP